ncbi:MAG: hypothetical protein ABGX20_05640 [Bacillus sp. (in: firmicutes)]
MLAKINELNKNVVILLSVGIIAVTSIIITLIATSEGAGSGAKSLAEFQDFFVKEYGVKPNIQIDLIGVSENQAETITDSLAKKLNLGDAKIKEYNGTEWYSTESKDGDISVSAFYD